MKIEIISGSARPERKSHQVALAIQHELGKTEGAQAGMLDVAEFNFPLLEYVFASHPKPSEKMKTFSRRIIAADALIVVSPEHNGSYSGALKNTMDHFYKEYSGKPLGIVTVSTGVRGGISAMVNLQQYALKLNTILFPQGLATPKVQDLFENGKLTDQKYKTQLSDFISNFITFARQFV